MEATFPPYFLGKFYALSREFCQFIAEHGQDMAIEHQRHLGGSEDLMIGRLYERWAKQLPESGLAGCDTPSREEEPARS